LQILAEKMPKTAEKYPKGSQMSVKRVLKIKKSLKRAVYKASIAKHLDADTKNFYKNKKFQRGYPQVFL
jgi:hypothetical protein